MQPDSSHSFRSVQMTATWRQRAAGASPRHAWWAPAAVLLLFAACSKNEAVREDLTALDEFTAQLVAEVESASDPAVGVKAGAELLAARRAEMTERMSRMRAVRGFQVNDETKAALASSLAGNLSKVTGLKIDLMRATFRNPELSDELDQLIDDYNKLLQGG